MDNVKCTFQKFGWVKRAAVLGSGLCVNLPRLIKCSFVRRAVQTLFFEQDSVQLLLLRSTDEPDVTKIEKLPLVRNLTNAIPVFPCANVERTGS